MAVRNLRNNYLKCKWSKFSNQKTARLNGLKKTKTKTPIFYLQGTHFSVYIILGITYNKVSRNVYVQRHTEGQQVHGKMLNITNHSVQFSRSVVSDSLQSHELQHARPPCPSPTPGVQSNSCPLSWWCHPAISSPVITFSSCPQSLPASESFPMSQLFTWGGQSTGVSALASVLPKNTQDWSPLEWTGWISLQSKGLSRVFSNTTVQKHQFFSTQLSSQSNSHIHTWPLEKP